MSNRGYQLYKTTIEANGIQSFNALGNAFYLIRSTDSIDIKTDKTAFSNYVEKQGISAEKTFTFSRIEVRNPHAYAVTVVLWMGFGKFEDGRGFLFDAQTEIVGSGVTTIANGASITFAGTPNGDRVQRRDITIANNDVAGALDLKDKNGNEFGSIPAGTSYLLTSNDEIEIENNSGGAIPYRVGETWYVI
jgi:hypothetical protein